MNELELYKRRLRNRLWSKAVALGFIAGSLLNLILNNF
jgi:hypothetical protein